MKKEDLVGKRVRLKDGSEAAIIAVEGNRFEEYVIHTDIPTKGKKLANQFRLFRLLLAAKLGSLAILDETLSQEIDEFIEKESKLERQKKKEEEEARKIAIEEELLERMKKTNGIRSFRGEYAWLSNAYEFPVTYDGVTYPNAEAAFQAQKDVSRREEFIHLTGAKAKNLGRKVNLRPDWEKVKNTIMEEVVRAKFTQSEDLLARLIATKDRYLEEGNSCNDTYWGFCKGKGQNHLGKILMKVREDLQKA